MYNPRVSVGGDITKPDLLVESSLETILLKIKSGSSKVNHIISDIRDNKNTSVKKRLPYILFSGTFSERKESGIVTHSNLIVLDFDDKQLEGISPQEKKELLKEDPFIYCAFISPSGDGVKALVRIDSGRNHKDHFRALDSRFNVDKSGSDLSRACFMSYDPDIYINPQAFVFSEVIKDRSFVDKNKPSVSKGLFKSSNYSVMDIPSRMIARAEDGSKHNVLAKAAYLTGGFVSSGLIDADVAKFILEKEIGKKENVKDLQSAYKTISSCLSDGFNAPTTVFDRESKRIIKDFGESIFNFVVEPDDVMTELLNRRDNISQRTWSTGSVELDKHFLWKKNKLVVNLGHDKVGKTLFSLNMAMSTAVNHGWKWIIYAIENTSEDIWQELIELVAMKRMDSTGIPSIDKWRMTDSEFSNAISFVNEHFKIIEPNTGFGVDELLFKCVELLEVKSYQYVLVDPFNALNQSGNYTYNQFIQDSNKMRIFTREHCGIWLNIHTKTEAKKKPRVGGKRPIPERYDGEFGSNWANKCDTFVVTHRDSQITVPESEKYTTTFLVESERNTKLGTLPHSRTDDPFIDGYRMRYHLYKFISENSEESLFESPLKTKIEL